VAVIALSSVTVSFNDECNGPFGWTVALSALLDNDGNNDEDTTRFFNGMICCECFSFAMIVVVAPAAVNEQLRRRFFAGGTSSIEGLLGRSVLLSSPQRGTITTGSCS